MHVMKKVEESQIQFKSHWFYICKTGELREKEHLTVNLMYAGELQPFIIFRFNSEAYAYFNRCVHMPRKLNCESNAIFDETGNYLRCSMHGIVYDPVTGASQSSMCHGEKLKSVKVVEEGGNIYLHDKRLFSKSNLI